MTSDGLYLKEDILEQPWILHGNFSEYSEHSNHTYKVRDEETDEALVEGINHVHPEHVGFIFL